MWLVPWPSRLSARSSALFNLYMSSLGHITTSPRHQNIFLLPPSYHTPPTQPSLLSCWNTQLRLQNFQISVLQEHPLRPSKFSCPVIHPLPLPLQRIHQADHPSACLATHWARSSSSLRKALHNPAPSYLTDLHHRHSADSPPLLWEGGATFSPPSLRTNSVTCEVVVGEGVGAEPSPSPSGTLGPSTSGTPTDSAHWKDESKPTAFHWSLMS